MSPTFERFTDRARRVLVLSQEISVLHRCDHIGPDHLLGALVAENEGVAAVVLREMGIDGKAMDDAMAKRWPPQDPLPVAESNVGDAIKKNTIPFTTRTKKILELSLREALQLGHNYIGTEHILLGILREGESDAAAMLTDVFGLELSEVRQTLLRTLSNYRTADENRARMALESVHRELDDVPDPAAAIAYHVTFRSRAAILPLLSWLAKFDAMNGPLAENHPVRILHAALEAGGETRQAS